jgi:flagellar hook assembly protein FlgD
MRDASKPEETFDNLYVYPNPVYPTYKGYITIKGVMSNTLVRILDANGNLVKLIESTGGSAIWDGTNAHGDRVASGTYTVICNTSDGQSNGITKVLIMN